MCYYIHPAIDLKLLMEEPHKFIEDILKLPVSNSVEDENPNKRGDKDDDFEEQSEESEESEKDEKNEREDNETEPVPQKRRRKAIQKSQVTASKSKRSKEETNDILSTLSVSIYFVCN